MEDKPESKKEDKSFSSYSDPQPEKKKESTRKLVAKKKCRINLDGCVVELVEGEEVHGLKREERDHLLFHGFIG